MIDTVILTVTPLDYQILLHSKFTPSSEILFRQGNYLIKCVNNPTAEDKKEGIYKPRLTLIKRRRNYCDEIPLKIEFSIPKLLYDNNLDEASGSEAEFEQVVMRLHTRLLSMGVLVKREAIARASVSAFHASKNISLSGGYTVTMAIKEFAKVNLTRKLDLTKTKFSNEGHSLQFYANSHSFVIYDKIQDMKKSKGRAVDKDQTGYQMSLFDDLKKADSHLEVLRFEVRLSKKVKMNSTLEKLGYRRNPQFKDVFNKDLCQKIIEMYWHDLVYDTHPFLFDMNNNPLNLLKDVKTKDPNIGIKEAVYMTGLNLLCKDEGMRELRSFIETNYSSKAWDRTAKLIKDLNVKFSNKKPHGFITDIANAIKLFEPMRIKI